MDGEALGAAALPDGSAAPGARLGPYVHAGRDVDGAQATTLAATSPPPAMAALRRNLRRLTAPAAAWTSSGLSETGPSVGVEMGCAGAVVMSMRRMVARTARALQVTSGP
jgi:hypothetical protein